MRLSPLPGRPLPLVAPGPSALPSGPEPRTGHRLSRWDCSSSPGRFGSISPLCSTGREGDVKQGERSTSRGS